MGRDSLSVCYTSQHTYTHTMLNGELLTMTVIEVGRVVACLEAGGEGMEDHQALLTISEL